jgi:hypothetical protein
MNTPCVSMFERPPVVLVEDEGSIGAGIDDDSERLIARLIHVLPDGSVRDDRAGANVKRHRLQIDGALEFAAACDPLLRPVVEPRSQYILMRVSRERPSRPSP